MNYLGQGALESKLGASKMPSYPMYTVIYDVKAHSKRALSLTQSFTHTQSHIIVRDIVPPIIHDGYNV